MTLSGSLMIDGGGLFRGRLEMTKTELSGYISRLRTAWADLLNYTDGTREAYGNKVHRPFAAAVDLNRFRGSSEFDDHMREVARIGSEFYEAIFLAANPRLKSGLAQLNQLLSEEERTVAIETDCPIIPWSILYLRDDKEKNIYVEDWVWSFKGFLGYSHRIEQIVPQSDDEDFDPLIRTDGQTYLRLFADRTLDENPNRQVVKPVIDTIDELDTLVRYDVATEHAVVFQRMAAGDRDGELFLFICHGYLSDDPGGPHLKLTDKKAIYAADFHKWFASKRLENNPVVLLMICDGGQLATPDQDSIGLSFLNHGGNCLVGPHIAVPQDFAREYTREFVRRVLRGERIGDIVIDLGRAFADDYNNPLAIAMGLNRGLGSRIVGPESSPN
jgi:hypothetical protein